MTENFAPDTGSFSPTVSEILPQIEAVSCETAASYEKCIFCPDHGKNCKGPKLSALQTIGNVRAYHRRLRDARKIPMKSIFALTEKEISSATVKDYFSHEEKGFVWTTVAQIDNALLAICGERVGVEPDEIPPCPATSTEISAMMSEERKKRAEAESRCVELQDQIVAMQEKCNQKVARVKSEYADGFSFLKTEVSDLKAEKADYLKRIDKKNRILTLLSVITLLLAIATTVLLIYK